MSLLRGSPFSEMKPEYVRLRQELIDAAPCHDVTSEEQLEQSACVQFLYFGRLALLSESVKP